jgi:hypothetical protein
MSVNDSVRIWFSIAFIVLVSASIGAIIEANDKPAGYEAGAALILAMGIGVGLWTAADIIRSRRGGKDEGDE